MIDLHTHFFNLKYLPVAGIIRRYTNNIMPIPIALGIQWYLWRKTHSNFQLTQEEWINPNETNNRANKPLGEQEISKKEPPIAFSETDLIEYIWQAANQEDLNDTELSIALDLFQDLHAGPNDKKVKLSQREIGKPFTTEELMTIKEWFKKMFEWLIKLIDQAVGIVNAGLNHIRWFIFMATGEQKMFEHLDKIDAPGINLFVHHTMDVDYFFTDDVTGRKYNSYYDFPTTQLRKMTELQKAYKGRVLGFVAFNPSRPDGLDIVKLAIRQGFNGVKFYPPLGYKPSNDSNSTFASRIEELMKFCVAFDIPILAHCNNRGFEARPRENSGTCSNPIYWEQVLSDPRFRNLRLCLGHGGGGQGWFSENKNEDHVNPAEILATDIRDSDAAQQVWNNSYAAMVYKLSVVYPNVYCDASYLDELFLPGGSPNPTASKNFKTRLVNLFSASSFSEKIIYGSDWHMLFREGKNKLYFSQYKSFFNDPVFNNTRSKFFNDNAKKFLKI